MKHFKQTICNACFPLFKLMKSFFLVKIKGAAFENLFTFVYCEIDVVEAVAGWTWRLAGD